MARKTIAQKWIAGKLGNGSKWYPLEVIFPFRTDPLYQLYLFADGSMAHSYCNYDPVFVKVGSELGDKVDRFLLLRCKRKTLERSLALIEILTDVANAMLLVG
jgi:hypothetical protein